MRTAIISDLHANHEALLAVCADIDGQACNRVLCLGDIVDWGEPAELVVVQEVMRRGFICVRGNHDEWAPLEAGTPEDRFLKELPGEIVEGDVVYTHISPRPGERKVSDRIEAWNVFEETRQRLAFIGHTHIPAVYSFNRGSVGSAGIVRFRYGDPVRIEPNDRYVISVGAVGYGRDGVQAARYCVYDDVRATIEVRRVEAPMLRV